MPEHWVYSEHFEQTLPTEDAWWRQMDDELLDSLMAEGVARNYDVAMAARRIRLAALALQQTRSAWFPSIGLQAGWSKEKPESDFSLGLQMSWQIDVFGRVASAAKGKKAARNVAAADYAAAMVTLCGNIATSYVELRAAQEQLAVAREHLATQQKVMEITRARFECDLASKLDVEQARSVYESTHASIPQLEVTARAAVNSLALLLAVSPDSLAPRLNRPAGLPPYLQMVQTGVPMDLLRRRPDVVAAEQTLAEYAAAIGVAKKDFLPTLSLDASIGTQNRRLDGLFHSGSYTYTIAPTLSWTVFDGLSRRAALLSARENMEIGIENYNFTLQQAVSETDNAMFSYLRTLEQISALEEAAQAAAESFNLSLDLYKSGLSIFTNVMDAQEDYLNYTNEVITARASALKSLIQLYEALGGGWNGSL